MRIINIQTMDSPAEVLITLILVFSKTSGKLRLYDDKFYIHKRIGYDSTLREFVRSWLF